VSDATTPPSGEAGLSEEAAREYAKQLRSAPAEQIVTEILSSLLNLAQVKLGRRDARLLIDLCAILVGQARPHLSSELTRQVDQALSELRLAQVRAEGAATGTAGRAEPNDLAEAPAPPAGTGTQPAPGPTGSSSPVAPGGPGQPPPAGRLWVPGRDF
jgi:hypothetical protein